MKKLVKTKKELTIKNNLKISNFFAVQSKSVPKEVPSSNGDKNICNNLLKHEVIALDSDDDFTDIPKLGSCKANKNHINKSNVNIRRSENTSNKLSPTTKKRKLKEIDTKSPPQKKSNIEGDEPDKVEPSTSEYKLTPTKQSHGQVIFIKSPEKLLSPEALKEYHTPEKQMERFLSKIIKSPTPKKLLFNEARVTESCSNSSTNDSFLSLVDNFHKTEKMKKVQVKKRTPEKNNSNQSSNSKDTEQIIGIEKTPNKIKKTPRKLFETSPNNLNDFNVQIINKFVTITPSKNNKLDPDVIFVRSSEKKQSSILKYISPKASAKSLETQRQNESTPTKDLTFTTESLTPAAKVKTKLDFSNCSIGSTVSNRIKAPNKIENDNETLHNLKSETLKVLVEEELQSSKLLPHCSKYNHNNDLENDFNFANLKESFSGDWQDINVPEYNLDLTDSQHCKVTNINRIKNGNILTVQSTKNGEQAICNLEGFWIYVEINIGDIVHVSAKKLNEGEWIINNDYGLLVYEPDLLVSTTSIVNTIWCKRKSVLNERFRGFDGDNQFMFVGSLVHSLLQIVLSNKHKSQQEIEKVARHIIKDPRSISRCYECGVSQDYIEEELMKFVPRVLNFVNLYIEDSVTKKKLDIKLNKDDWKGTIKDIEDIEENIWCPELGLKGKIDVNVKTNFNTMPLELKTGRATVSLEHRGQVIMYIMMMNKIGYNIPSGLLLYLREGILKEVCTTQQEKRDIMILRNELTYYLTRKPIIVDDGSKSKKLFPPGLPEPIDHRACANCPYNIICTSYARYNNEDISSKKILKNIQDEAMSHISDAHINYFMHWVSLLALESNTKKGSKDLREIYTLTPSEREINGKCIINLKITNVGNESNGMFEHSFEKVNNVFGINLVANGIEESNYVVVSTEERPGVSAGFVTDISTKSISVILDRNLNKRYADKIFHIDRYDSASAQSYNLTSLSLLLEQSTRAEKLRKIIIDKIPPTFKSGLPKQIGTKGKQILKRLNIVQQRAVLKAIAANDYFLIKGMPGTGKTSTIVALIQLLVELNKSVLITSHTHSAVDNVCMKLVHYGVKLLRLGSESRIHSSLKQYSEHTLTKNCTTPEQLAEVYNNVQVLAVTCMGSGHAVLNKRVVDICIIDESTQVIQSSVIRPLHSAKTFILIGDPDQLPAVVRNREAVEMGMSVSLFERLYTEKASTDLNLNYRMNSTITELANALTYNGKLLIGNENVANATLQLSNKEVLQTSYKDYHWILNVLDNSLENSVQFLDTGPIWNLQHEVPWLIHNKDVTDESSQNNSQSDVNIYEAALTYHLVEALIKAGVAPKDIGVIATYRLQVAQISNLLHADGVDISTVDQFQGKDKSVIIYSATKSRDITNYNIDKFELLEDKRRLNVAITRAKTKLIMLGDITTLMKFSTFKKIDAFIERNIIKVDKTAGFDWKTVLDINNSFKK